MENKKYFYCKYIDKALQAETIINRSLAKEENKNRIFKPNGIRVGDYVTITHPFKTDSWTIQIVPVEYKYKEVFIKTNDKQKPYRMIKQKVRICDENFLENRISQDSPLGQSLIGLIQGDTYSYTTIDETVTGKILEVKNKKK